MTTVTMKRRLQKLEDIQSQKLDTIKIGHITTLSDAETLLWDVARNGSDASRVQALKVLHELKFESNQALQDTRSEDEIRANNETLIAQYRELYPTPVSG